MPPTEPDALALAADLLSSPGLDVEALAEAAGRHGYTARTVTTADLELVRSVLETQRRVFTATEVRDAVETVNGLLRLAPVRPRLVPGDAGGPPELQMHADDEGFGLVYVSEFALAAAQLAAAGQLGRLRQCDGTGCSRVFVDRSRAGARRYCDTRTCGNRMNVAAYRKRQQPERR